MAFRDKGGEQSAIMPRYLSHRATAVCGRGNYSTPTHNNGVASQAAMVNDRQAAHLPTLSSTKVGQKRHTESQLLESSLHALP